MEYRWDESQKLKEDNPVLVGNQVLYERAIKELTKYYRCMSFTLDKTYELAGFDDTTPTEEDRKLYNSSGFNTEPPLHFEDGTVRQDGRYKEEDLKSLSLANLYSVYKEIISHNSSLKGQIGKQDPTKQEIINVLIDHDLCIGTKLVTNLDSNTVAIEDVESKELESENNEES